MSEESRAAVLFGSAIGRHHSVPCAILSVARQHGDDAALDPTPWWDFPLCVAAFWGATAPYRTELDPEVAHPEALCHLARRHCPPPTRHRRLMATARTS